MASAVMLLVGRYLASSGALVGAHGAPLRKVALGLGLACGAAGYFVVRRLRGNATRSAAPHNPTSLLKSVSYFLCESLQNFARTRAFCHALQNCTKSMATQLHETALVLALRAIPYEKGLLML